MFESGWLFDWMRLDSFLVLCRMWCVLVMIVLFSGVNCIVCLVCLISIMFSSVSRLCKFVERVDCEMK